MVFGNIEAIFFDKDGTLENSQNYLRELGVKRSRLIDAQIPGIGEPLLMAFGILDHQIDPAGLMSVGSRWENQIAAAAYIAETGRSWYESLKIAQNSFTEADKYLPRNPETSPLFPGVREFLKYLAATELKLGILTSDSPLGAENFVKNHQLEGYFQVAIGVTPPGPLKPDPALFWQACKKLGVAPEKTLMVGDSPFDLEMGNRGGAAGVIGIRWDGGQLENAEISIDNLNQIKIEK